MNQKKIYKNMLKEKNLSKYACLDKNAIRLNEYKGDIRPNYFRDIDRIIYSLSYTRYMDKTQVFTTQKNDHISKRMVHVQLVSKIARTIGRALSLNEDLIEAIALGHDIGHVPYGHLGERILNSISKECNEGVFMHNVQSVRTFMNVENNGNGSNLTVQVLDGILCHNGEEFLPKYEYKSKTAKEFLKDYKSCYKSKENINSLIPMTLEGCIVRVSDGIAYLGRDLEDANILGLVSKKDLPKEITSVLGYENRDIINTIILDIIDNSLGKNYIAISPKVYTAMNDLKTFNYQYIYNKANSNDDIKKIEKMFRKVFTTNVYFLENKMLDSDIYTVFLNNMSKKYINGNTIERIVIDYIAGMTDDFFKKQYDKAKKYDILK